MGKYLDRIYEFLVVYRLRIILCFTVIIYVAFFPGAFATYDEHNYLYNSRNLVEGTLRQDCREDETSQFRVGDYCIYKYNIGTSFFYLPFVMWAPQLAFLSTLGIYIFGVIVFDRLLARLGLSPVWVYLFAFFPANVYFSRTLFSEMYSAVLVLAGFYYLLVLYRWHRKQKLYGLVAGVLLGMSVAVRYTNAVVVLVMVCGLFLKMLLRIHTSGKSPKFNEVVQTFIKFKPVLLGGIPFLVSLLLFNNYLYDSPLRSGYFYSGEESMMNLHNILVMAPKYIVALALMYPAMILSPFFVRKCYRLVIGISVVVLLALVASFAGNNDVFKYRILDLVLGIRFMMPVLPLLMITYSCWLQKFLKFERVKRLLAAAIIVLMCNAVAIHIIHQDFLNTVGDL